MTVASPCRPLAGLSPTSPETGSWSFGGVDDAQLGLNLKKMLHKMLHTSVVGGSGGSPSVVIVPAQSVGRRFYRPVRRQEPHSHG